MPPRTSEPASIIAESVGRPVNGSVRVALTPLTCVVGVFVGFTLRQTASRIGFEIEYQIRVRLYERLQALNPRQLDEVATGQLVTRAVTDLSFLEAFAVLVPLLIVTFIVLSAIAVVKNCCAEASTECNCCET